MNWNYRLVDLTAQNDGETWIEIKEVYYERNRPVGYADIKIGDDEVGGVIEQLGRMVSACSKPVLVFDADDNLIEVKDEQGK
jgi:hypothetical protein